MNEDLNVEARLLGLNTVDYEKELEDEIEKEIQEARDDMKKRQNIKESQVLITNIAHLDKGKRFDKDTIYRVFNRKQKTETFVNGEQAENMVKYTDDYVVRFDHRVEYK